MTMQFHNNMIMQMIYILDKYGQKEICHTEDYVLSIRYLNKILFCEKEGKLQLMVALRSFPFLFVYKFLHFMTIRNRGPPFFHDYPKDNQENMEDKS